MARLTSPIIKDLNKLWGDIRPKRALVLYGFSFAYRFVFLCALFSNVNSALSVVAASLRLVRQVDSVRKRAHSD